MLITSVYANGSVVTFSNEACEFNKETHMVPRRNLVT